MFPRTLHIVHITSVSPNSNSSFVPQGFTWFSFYTSCRTPTGYRSYLGFFVGPTGPVAQGAGLAFFLHITPAICSFPHITPAILLLPPFWHFSAIFFSPPKPRNLSNSWVRWTMSAGHVPRKQVHCDGPLLGPTCQVHLV